ncbi:MAG: DUF134 domain-containing protein [Desulfarculus sp.]|nr:DUF134 domain-containing protein [Pseudomonadota bacterium]MBV1714992.1 DUF134 domain-containing protein [Desulfarculus sp.]MBU4573865.1 DUF134 domain-containing protein [Pseudomonadota bacterium]MBU4598955.1 DUF134 domain-containing protein [Pseudomonadota bacterium]MBV1737492.1 DUF134 domain-containing protein [Desulfarculus sp.]
MPRPRRCRRIYAEPPARRFGPYDRPPAGEVVLPVEGLEALRLAEVEGLDQEEAAALMGVSRQTFGRVLAAARTAVARALNGGMELVVAGGDYELVPPGPGRGMGRGHGGGRGMGRGMGRGRGGRQGGGPAQE